MANQELEDQYVELCEQFDQEINALILQTKRDMVDGPDDEGTLFNVLRAAHTAMAYHLGMVEELLKPMMVKGKIPIDKLYEQHKKYFEDGQKHAQKHLDHATHGSCEDCQS